MHMRNVRVHRTVRWLVTGTRLRILLNTEREAVKPFLVIPISMLLDTHEKGKSQENSASARC